jgi:hypothetical protein
MSMVLSEPLFYIFFIYGVSFLVMSYVVFRGIRKATVITLITTFYALVLFGLTHGITELIDWVRFILKIVGTGEVEVLKYLSQIFLITSFVLLLQFGISLLTYKSERRAVLRFIPVLLFGVYIVVLLILNVNDVLTAGLIARYSFGFSGALLSGIALYSLANSMKAVGDSTLFKGLIVIAIGFALYAVFGGLIIKPIVGLPVQLFRAACAFTISISSFYILNVFKASE